MPVQLYAASGDHDVPIANAYRCQQAMRADGAAARLIDVSEVDHAAPAILSVPRALARFDQLHG